MKTIMPDGKDGVFLADVGMPELFENSALCRVTHSLISCGTERGIIQANVGKSEDETIRQGIRLGYCGAGIVEAVQGEEIRLEKGQRVAFYGAPYVSHSEYVVVPKHLVLSLPQNVSFESAAFVGLGAVALHGFREGKVGLGDVCLVSGAGLIGNLCAQLATLAGCRVVMCDYEATRLEVFKKCVSQGCDFSCAAPEKAIEAVHEVSNKRGADAVFLCVSTNSSEPIEQAFRAIRPGGRIVIVGVLDIHIPREEFFAKEAEVTISRGAGPGRYDQEYERDGRDYPLQYVRWTEGRNLEEVLRLIASRRLNVLPLISRTYSLDEAGAAYARIMEAKPELGYIISWG
jgi:threonine dehydrogenase-like Zn-dependent dehydrogenase